MIRPPAPFDSVDIEVDAMLAPEDRAHLAHLDRTIVKILFSVFVVVTVLSFIAF